MIISSIKRDTWYESGNFAFVRTIPPVRYCFEFNPCRRITSSLYLFSRLFLLLHLFYSSSRPLVSSSLQHVPATLPLIKSNRASPTLPELQFCMLSMCRHQGTPFFVENFRILNRAPPKVLPYYMRVQSPNFQLFRIILECSAPGRFVAQPQI